MASFWLDRSVPATDALECAYACHPRYALHRAGEDHPDFQGRLSCTRLVMAAQPLSTKNETLQSDVDILGQ